MAVVCRRLRPCQPGCAHSPEPDSPPRPCDRVFIVESWISSYRRSPHAGLVSMAAWHEVMERVVSDIIDRPEVNVLVAADPSATDGMADLLGWMAWMHAGNVPVVFYAYTKHPYRRNGIAARLFAAARIDPRAPFSYVCNTHMVGTLREAGLIRSATWKPLLGRFPNERGPHAARSEADDAA